MAEQDTKAAPEVQDSRPSFPDIDNLGETELEKDETPASEPEKTPPVKGEDPTEQPSGTPAQKQDGDDVKPDDEPSEVDVLISEMKNLKQTNEEEYNKKLEDLKKDEPLKAAVWEQHQRTAGLQKGFAEERKARRDKEKELLEIKRNKAKSEIDGFQELGQEEIDDLNKEDYAEYVLQKQAIEAKKEALKQTELSDIEVEQVGEFKDFLFNTFGLDVGQSTTQADIDEKISPQVVAQVDAKLETIFGKDTVYTAEQIALVYNDVIRDDVLQKERIKARQDLNLSIEDAENGRGGSRLDSRPTGPGKTQQTKKLDDMTIQEIDAMGEKEFESAFPD